MPWIPLTSLLSWLPVSVCCLPLDNGITSPDWTTGEPGTFFALQGSPGSQAPSHISACLASSPSLSCSPQSLIGFSWKLFSNKSQAHKSWAQSCFWENTDSEDYHESQSHRRQMSPTLTRRPVTATQHVHVSTLHILYFWVITKHRYFLYVHLFP